MHCDNVYCMACLNSKNGSMFALDKEGVRHHIIMLISPDFLIIISFIPYLFKKAFSG